MFEDRKAVDTGIDGVFCILVPFQDFGKSDFAAFVNPQGLEDPDALLQT